MSDTLPGLAEPATCHLWHPAEAKFKDLWRCTCCYSQADIRWCARCYLYACKRCRADGEANTAGECSEPLITSPVQAWAEIERALRELGYTIDVKSGRIESAVCIIGPEGATRLAKVGRSPLSALVSAASKIDGVVNEDHERAARWDASETEAREFWLRLPSWERKRT